jgi:hypothetical protein
MKHIHHDMIIEWAADTTRVVQLYVGEEWTDVDNPTWERFIKYRIKPETRSINGVEFGAPTGEEGQWCFTPAHAARLMDFFWSEAEDRDTAYKAIVDALEGKK